MKYCLLAASVFLACRTAAATASSASKHAIAIIVSADSPLPGLTVGELRRIFLGQTTRWKNGRRIAVFVGPPMSRDTQVFLERVVHLSDIDYAQWWIGAVYRGDVARGPRTFGDEETLIAAVAENRDAVGFVGADIRLPPTVRVVPIDGLFPNEARYPLAR